MLKSTNPVPLFVTYALCWFWLAALTTPAAAVITHWQHDPATPGDWFEPANWDNGVPTSSSDYVYIDNGGTAQIASPGVECYRLHLGYTAGQNGTVELSGETSSLWSFYQDVGHSGTGTFTQTGGTNTVYYHLYLGDEGTGTFTQTGGTNTVGYYLYLGYRSGSSGTYELSGTGQLSAKDEYIGDDGTGTFSQTGGTNTVNRSLYLGTSSGSSGTYELSGTGQLSASDEYVGYFGTGTFSQNGGSNATTYLSIGDNGSYVLSGGTLHVSGSASVTGTLDFASGSGSATMAGLVNLGETTLNGAGSTTFTLGPNSLLIVPAGFDPESEFGEFINHGSHVHNLGSTLYIEATETIAGRGTITDHVDIQGSLHATTGQKISLKSGLRISGNGSVDLGTGILFVDDDFSGISDDGELSANYEYVGFFGTGTFTQTGGTNTVGSDLYLGYWSGFSGTYELSGAGQLSAEDEYVGHYGTGTFTQTGGTNTVGDDLYLGYKFGSSGTYELSGAGQLSAEREYVGRYGTGTFTQTGGTNTVSRYLHLGHRSGSSGTYELSGTGQLSAYYEYVGASGTGTFMQTGGTNTVSRSLLLGYNSGSSGTYVLSGTGQLSAEDESVGFFGTGTFAQTDGMNTVSRHLYLGHESRSSGTYALSGTGQLSAEREYVGYYGTGTFVQNGGTNTISEKFYMGRYAGSNGTYELHDGKLSAMYECVGCEGTGTFVQNGGTNTVGLSLWVSGSSEIGGTYELHDGALSARNEFIRDGGLFDQRGGTNTTGYLSVYDEGSYVLSGGTLQVTESALVTGTLDFASGSGSVTMAGLVDLGEATISGAGSTSFSLGPNSLLIVPAGFNPETRFAEFVNSGSIVHNLGSTLHIPDTNAVIGRGTITDHVQIQGSLHAATNRSIDLSGGLHVSGNGSVQLGGGTLHVDNNISGISGAGELSTDTEYIGHHGTGTFVQTGGGNTISEYLYVGHDSGSTGTYVLNAGELSATSELVGDTGTGTFVQTGGGNTMMCDLCLAYMPGSVGMYMLHAGALSARNEFVGCNGTGTFVQTGGSNTISERFDIGRYFNSNGTYELHAGELSACIEHIGHSGTGTFVQIGGSNTILGDADGSGFYIGDDSGAVGMYELHGGELSARDEHVGYEGTGTFVQNGGNNIIRDSYSLYLGHMSGSTGTYELHAGELSTNYEYVGYFGTGTFMQTGGTNMVNSSLRLGYYGTGTFTQTGGTNTVSSSLYLGRYSGSSGIYELSGTGQLSAEYELVGGGGTGTFTQTGGTNTVSKDLVLGISSGSSGTYTISAGQLATASLYVGYDGSGTLNITDPAASITVSRRLHFGPGGTLTAVPGSTIHMTGSALENESTNPDALAGLANLTLIFEGGADIDPFEVAGEDMGAVRKGFCGNFAMDTLQLDGEVGVGQVQLVDLIDNQPDWEGSEALYVENLLLGSGSYLGLNGLNLYFHNFIDLGGFIEELGGGNLIQVSIPGDANRDDVVDDQDASILANHWQQSGMYWEDGDFNNDGIVDDQDASILAAHWQQTWEDEGAAAVPEPSAILLCIPLCLAGLLLGRRQARRLNEMPLDQIQCL